MELWTGFWGIFIVAGLSIFAVISVVVGIGGFSDLRQLFRDIESQHDAEDALEKSGGD